MILNFKQFSGSSCKIHFTWSFFFFYKFPKSKKCLRRIAFAKTMAPLLCATNMWSSNDHKTSNLRESYPLMCIQSRSERSKGVFFSWGHLYQCIIFCNKHLSQSTVFLRMSWPFSLFSAKHHLGNHWQFERKMKTTFWE